MRTIGLEEHFVTPELAAYGTDYPFEDMEIATDFLAAAPITESERAAIAHGNAERLPRL